MGASSQDNNNISIMSNKSTIACETKRSRQEIIIRDFKSFLGHSSLFPAKEKQLSSMPSIHIYPNQNISHCLNFEATFHLREGGVAAEDDQVVVASVAIADTSSLAADSAEYAARGAVLLPSSTTEYTDWKKNTDSKLIVAEVEYLRKPMMEEVDENGDLTITCLVEVMYTKKYGGSSLSASGRVEYDFGKMLDEDDTCLSDVQIINRGAILKCHKVILAAKSQVWKGLFKQNKELFEITVEDVATEVLEKLVRFIYTGSVSFGNHTKELLVAADVYGVKSLFEVCEEALLSVLSVQNVAELLILGTTRKADKLEMAALKLAAANLQAVKMVSSGWLEIKESHPGILLELLAAVEAARQGEEQAAAAT